MSQSQLEELETSGQTHVGNAAPELEYIPIEHPAEGIARQMVVGEDDGLSLSLRASCWSLLNLHPHEQISLVVQGRALLCRRQRTYRRQATCCTFPPIPGMVQP